MTAHQKLLILPGFSLKNKDWAEATKSELETHFPTEIVYWKHWTTGEPEQDWLQKEAINVKKLANGESVNVLAKSIATAIVGIAIESGLSVNKLILCGIPINDFLPGTEKYYKTMRSFPTEKIIIFQNEKDPHGSFVQTKEFISGLISEANIISKPKADHEYSYSSDFVNFLLK